MARYSILNSEEIKELERETTRFGPSYITLMERAGTAVYHEILEHYLPRKTLVLVGPGNNGGDGYVVAQKLHHDGWSVHVMAFSSSQPSEAANYHKEQYQGSHVEFNPDKIAEYDLIIDGLFGVGLTRPLEGAYLETIQSVNKVHKEVISIDIPSGINSDNGEIMGDAIKATMTVTFEHMKPGHVLLPGAEHTGSVVCKDISLQKLRHPRFLMNDPELWQEDLPTPSPADLKYTRGNSLILGSCHMSGATRLAAHAARRMGSGLVSIASPLQTQLIYALSSPGFLTPTCMTSDDWFNLVHDPKVKGILVGPGLEGDQQTRDCTLIALASKKPCVLDAGVFSAFQHHTHDLITSLHPNCILTPHAAEFKRIFRINAGNKIENCFEAAKEARCTVLMKGFDTIIATPNQVLVNNNGSPHLASGGTGDTLSGMILSLITQGMKPFLAGAAASWIMNEIANEIGQGLVAEDISENILNYHSRLFNKKHLDFA